MVEEFVASYAKLIVNHPAMIEVVHYMEGDVKQIVIYTHQEDVGKLIGKEGKMIGSIKTLISGCKAKDSLSYRINVEAKA
ncbi:MAG: RNA-binding protein [Sulfurovum sp. PC08-66]|nr:MAG: RNA-binding protein [Sulfurovum sp. PC08-66]KIM12501.1 MAG: RNA-binding protein [Sulfuricurvum sp. PC08-66]